MSSRAVLAAALIAGGLLSGCSADSTGASPQRVPATEVPPATVSRTASPALSGSAAAAPGPGTGVDGAMEEKIRKAFLAMKDRTAAESWPEKDASGAWKTPGGKAISRTFVIGYSRPKELEGVPRTAYVSLDEKQYWVHEGGGISGQNDWFGPFPLP